MNVRFFDPATGYKKYKTEYDEAILKCLEKGDLILREDVEKFEENLARYTSKKYAIGLNSGTDALYLALKAACTREDGFNVETRSHTFVATVQVIQQLGKTPVLKESDEMLSSNIVIPVHIGGIVDKLAFPTSRVIIEDACQALGASGVGFGLIQAYSFYPAKILGGIGDGGAITTDDKELANKIKELRNHWKSTYTHWGINSRLDNIQAAYLNVKIKYLDEIQQRRKQIAELYLQELENVGLPDNPIGRVWQDFIIQLPNTKLRYSLFSYLKENGIETMVNEYPMPIAKLPKAEIYEATTLRIPCNENLRDDEVEYIIEKINEWRWR